MKHLYIFFSLLFLNRYFLLLLPGVLPWAGCGSETADIPVSRAGQLVFLTPAGSTRQDDGQQLLVILQPILLEIHRGLAKLGKFLKIFAAWWFIQTEQVSPAVCSSRRAGMGPHAPARQAEKGDGGFPAWPPGMPCCAMAAESASPAESTSQKPANPPQVGRI